MNYIYMDESGDLGFNWDKNGTSKYFIITLVATSQKKIVDKIVKKTFASMTKNELKHHRGVLHAFRESPKTRHRLLDCIGNTDELTIMYIYLNKKKVYTRLQVADMASWAIFRFLEKGDREYFTKIENKIVEGNPLFP